MTAPFDLVLMTDDHSEIDSIAEQAKLAEEHGFANVTMGETTGWNIVPVLTVIAERTDEIGITDDVLSPYARAPTVYAQTALTMDEITDGRFRLGLGTSSPALAERWHGGEFDRPLRRLRETIDIVHEVYEGGSVTYDGEIYDLGGLSYERSIPDQPPAIDVAALGPKGTELTGRFADGWVPQLFTVEGLEDRLADLRRGAELGERSAEEIRVSPLIRTFASEDPDRARAVAKQMISFLIGAYGPFYGNSIAEQGYEDTVAEIRDLWENRDTAAMAEALPDDLLDSVAAVGTPEDVRSKLDTFADIEGVDAIRLGFVSGMSQEDKEFTMTAVEPMIE
ncbi:TIGR04024 family LLM class F420-dependent oxidoreductase [Halovenus sp. WSH3]|uniref:TIGR04024 family LLM class F420-dependent oxidoreductase n=1 Tax=Halovenus carboxidivorans TaxID=2692199 RepID=A0A6B0TA24_9EURY|nr:TIGR04024 family LLM class F420-dependent oxidoreductase [Halovenus carboxidivorans]MXR50039.1 TIGR04024 family LLM class F420-dependent oxidoreductase [Halovenus carboxidivorans]